MALLSYLFSGGVDLVVAAVAGVAVFISFAVAVVVGDVIADVVVNSCFCYFSSSAPSSPYSP